MFRCDSCDEVTRPGEEENLIPSELRVRRYRARTNANLSSVSWKKKPVQRDDPGGIGYEWRGEQRVCASCYKDYVDTREQARIRQVEARVESIAAK